MDIRVTAAWDCGNDVLAVEGEAGSPPKPVKATGWVSALSNHYGPECYDKDGNRKPDAKPRKMNDQESRDYCLGLLRAALEAHLRPLAAPVRLL